MTVLDTARLRLRVFRDDDRAAMVALAGNWEVARWLTRLPHPDTEADADFWIARVRQDHASGRPRSFAVAQPVPYGGLNRSRSTAQACCGGWHRRVICSL